MNILLWILIVVVLWILIKSFTFLRVLLTIVIGIVYIPINTLNTAVQKWYFRERQKDKIIYYAFAPFYWILVGLTFLVSVPYEFVVTEKLH